MKLKYTSIDPETASREEIQAEINRLQFLFKECKNEEQAIKILINSAYGILGNKWFLLFNADVAESVTIQGQNFIKHAEMVIEKYFHDIWPKDKELHDKLGIADVKSVIKPLCVYGDTDSVRADTKIDLEDCSLSIEELFKMLSKIKDCVIINKNEIIKDANVNVLNWRNSDLYYAKVSKIIRHKVTKSKWKIKTKSGKEVFVTGDHSLVVFREGKKIVVKPSEILKTDKILTVCHDI